MNRRQGFARGGADWRGTIGGGLAVAAACLLGAAAPARAAGVEHPDVGTIAIGRGGAYAAAPVDGLAMQYNPAGFASQTGLRLTLDGNLAWQGLSFTPLGGDGSTTVSNSGGAFLVPAGAISYGIGAVGPLSGLTFALGATGPSAIGKESYPAGGAQRYALIASDYFIAYYSAALAASFRSWLSAGVTFQLVRGSAKFSQAVWSGSGPGTDPNQDAVADVDVHSGFIPTAVLGVSVRPIPRLAVGLSYRPRFNFRASGTLITPPDQLPLSAVAAQVHQVGTATDFSVRFPDVIRLGALYEFNARWLVEADVVAELWSNLDAIRLLPQGIVIRSESFDIEKPLQNIIFQKDFEDAVSVRVGGDYVVLPGRLTVRAGYLHETSAVPLRSVSVDFGNWQRDVVSAGGSIVITPRIMASFAYAHHFVADQHVTNSQVVQVVTPCLTPGCTDAAPTAVGNGDYHASLDVASLSLRLILDDLRRRP